MYKKRTLKILALIAGSLISISSLALEQFNPKNYLVDFSNPLAVYTNLGLGMSNDGADIYGGIGGYLTGSFKQQLQIEAKGDLDYYNVNYLAVDSISETGFLLDSIWSRDYYWTTSNANDTSLGVIKKVPVIEGLVSVYPTLKFGYIWGGGVEDTSYLKLQIPIRFNIIQGFWAGMTPAYTHGMKGFDLNEWNGSLDAGYMFKNGVGLFAQTVLDSHEDTQYRANVTLAF
ncbi:MAG: hypothetical protein KAH18_08510 [Psychromonas sp.]|nr:hypothetical protein [Psychromonas sp.]